MAGVHAANGDQARQYAADGYRMITVSSDLAMLRSYARTQLRNARQEESATPERTYAGRSPWSWQGPARWRVKDRRGCPPGRKGKQGGQFVADFEVLGQEMGVGT